MLKGNANGNIREYILSEEQIVYVINSRKLNFLKDKILQYININIAFNLFTYVFLHSDGIVLSN